MARQIRKTRKLSKISQTGKESRPRDLFWKEIEKILSPQKIINALPKIGHGRQAIVEIPGVVDKALVVLDPLIEHPTIANPYGRYCVREVLAADLSKQPLAETNDDDLVFYQNRIFKSSRGYHCTPLFAFSPPTSLSLRICQEWTQFKDIDNILLTRNKEIVKRVIQYAQADW